MINLSESQILAVIILTALAVINLVSAFRLFLKGGRRARIGALLVFASFFWIIGAALELAASSFEHKLFWNNFQHLGISIIPPFWLIYIFEYVGYRKWVQIRTAAALLLLPVIAYLLILTNQNHYFYWKEVYLPLGGSYIETSSAPGEIIYRAYAYVCVAAGLALLVQVMHRSGRLYRWQGSVLLLVVLTPWLADLALLLFGVDPLSGSQIAPFALGLMLPFITLGFDMLRKADITPVAHSTVVEKMADSVIVLDPHNRLLDYNPAAGALMDLKPGEGRGQPLIQSMPEMASLLAAVEQGEKNLEIVFSSPVDDDVRTYDARATTLSDSQGRTVSKVIVLRDISDRVQTEERIRESLREKEVLLKEIHHRVKNNLQIVCSLLSLQAGQVQDPDTVNTLQDSQNRIRSMALIHEKLYQSESLARVDFGSYTASLVSYLVRSYAANCHRVQTDLKVEDLPLAIDMAMPCGLIVNELVSNALKYAFPDSRAGLITVRFERAGEDFAVLTVADDGGGIPEHIDVFETKSLGLQLVNSLVEQLDGRLEIARTAGTRFRITIPYPYSK